MTLPVKWLSEAVDELVTATDRYDGLEDGLGIRFLNAVDATIELVQKNPFGYSLLRNGRRRANVKRFPYGLFFDVEGDEIIIVSCFHAKRNPEEWQKR